MKTKNLSPFDLLQVNKHLEELDRIASAAGGINAVLDTIVEANEAESDWPLRNNTRVHAPSAIPWKSSSLPPPPPPNPSAS